MSGLSGIRVLEIGHGVAVAWAAKLFADLGADVVRVESSIEFVKGRPFNVAAWLNTNKRPVTVGRPEEMGQLARGADIVLHGFAPGQAEKYGLGYETLSASSPAVVVCAITPFGSTGPYAGFRGEELSIIHGSSWGFLSPAGSTDLTRPPLKAPGHHASINAATMAASVALAAYEAADRTGIGDFVDFSLFAAAAKMTEWAPARALFMGQDSSRAGSKASSPWGIYKCQDGLIQVLCAEEVQWQCLVTLMGKPDWSQLEVFATVADRQANRDLVDMYLGDWFAEKRVADVYHAGQRAGVCLTPVHTMSELGEDSYFRERGFFYQSPEGPLLPGPPYRIDKPWWRAAPPPRSGASRGETWRERRLTRTTAPERGGAQPLEGIRVCDFTWVWAGPFCTQLLAHLGADVIRVESRERPDYFRRAPIHPVGMEPTLETSGVYQTFNSDKRSIAVDLRHPDARQLILDLVKHSDVVIDNFSVGTMAQFGLGVADLRAANPSVVVASLSGYGQTGQRAHYMGYGPVGGAIAGQFTANGYGRGDVMEPAIAVGDPSMGLSALWGLIASLTARRRTGESATLDIAMTEATAATFGELWMEYVTTGENPIPRANHDPQWAPHSCYPAAGDDEWVTIACTTDAEWRALCTVVSPNLVDDKRFADSESRKIHEDELDKHIAEWTRGRDRWVITRKLQAVGVAAFPSLSPLELWSGDRQLAAIGMLEVIDHPVTGARAIPGIPWRFQNARNGLRRPAPLLGQHTDEVLAEVLGLDGATLSDLHDRGVLR